MEIINLYWLVGLVLLLIVYLCLFKTKIGKKFLFNFLGYGCYVCDQIRDDDKEIDVIKTEYPGPLKIFGDSIDYINTWGTSLKSIEAKNFVITFWINNEITIRAKSEYKDHTLDKEEQLEEIERFKKQFFKRVKVDKSEFYKTRMKYGIDIKERSK